MPKKALDKKDSNKWDTKKTLEKVSISTLPDYVSENESKLNDVKLSGLL